jgi:hypothetical protein
MLRYCKKMYLLKRGLCSYTVHYIYSATSSIEVVQ